MSRPRHVKRRIKLIKPGLQLRLTAVLVGYAFLALMLYSLLLAGSLSQLANTLPRDGGLVMDRLLQTIGGPLGMTVLLAIPAVLGVGILTTFRIAGPIYRMEQYLHAIQRGERPPDCKLREGDELKDFCSLLNEATRPLREQQDTEQDLEQEEEPRSRAAGEQLPDQNRTSKGSVTS